jgi:hypothetical protein
LLRLPSPQRESVSSRRRRRSALGLLAELGISQKTWRSLRHLMRDEDQRIAAVACNICLNIDATSDIDDAVRRLIDLLPDADWTLLEEIETCLIRHFDKAKHVIAAAVQASEVDDRSAEPRAIAVLRRIMQRAEAASGVR